MSDLVLETWEVRQLVIERHKERAGSLSGSCAALVRWLKRDHNMLTDEKTIQWWIDQETADD